MKISFRQFAFGSSCLAAFCQVTYHPAIAPADEAGRASSGRRDEQQGSPPSVDVPVRAQRISAPDEESIFDDLLTGDGWSEARGNGPPPPRLPNQSRRTIRPVDAESPARLADGGKNVSPTSPPGSLATQPPTAPTTFPQTVPVGRGCPPASCFCRPVCPSELFREQNCFVPCGPSSGASRRETSAVPARQEPVPAAPSQPSADPVAITPTPPETPSPVSRVSGRSAQLHAALDSLKSSPTVRPLPAVPPRPLEPITDPAPPNVSSDQTAEEVVDEEPQETMTPGGGDESFESPFEEDRGGRVGRARVSLSPQPVAPDQNFAPADDPAAKRAARMRVLLDSMESERQRLEEAAPMTAVEQVQDEPPTESQDTQENAEPQDQGSEEEIPQEGDAVPQSSIQKRVAALRRLNEPDLNSVPEPARQDELVGRLEAELAEAEQQHRSTSSRKAEQHSDRGVAKKTGVVAASRSIEPEDAAAARTEANIHSTTRRGRQVPQDVAPTSELDRVRVRLEATRFARPPAAPASQPPFDPSLPGHAKLNSGPADVSPEHPESTTSSLPSEPPVGPPGMQSPQPRSNGLRPAGGRPWWKKVFSR